MQKELGNFRKSYGKKSLLEAELPQEPMQVFRIWYEEAEHAEAIDEANAMTLSTLGKDGFPRGRVVLLKKFSSDGFVFFTNYLSEKGSAISAHSQVCLSFFWPALERQVIIKGKAAKISEQESDTYFESRPDGSKLSAMVSAQSSVIPSREALEAALTSLEREYAEKKITRPPHWGGYLVTPLEIEFWQGRPNRLHDRIRFSLLPDGNWNRERLAP